MPLDHDPSENPRLAEALRAAYTHRTPIPPIRDQFIRASAQAHFARRRIVRQMITWGASVAAGLAAAIALIVLLNRPMQPTSTVARGDINADGQVNIVDALALARHLSNRDASIKSWDFNNDGIIDQKDVDAIAQSAVTLKPAQASLPTLHQLGLAQKPTHLAPGLPGVPLAQANTPKETPQ